MWRVVKINIVTSSKSWHCASFSFPRVRLHRRTRRVTIRNRRTAGNIRKRTIWGRTQCEYSYKQKGNLKDHVMRKHTGERLFKCNECSYATFTNAIIVLHRRTHTGEKPFSCSQCEFSCTRKGNLKEHVMRKHTGERPFKCNECSYATFTNAILVKHRRTHTGEKPFSCSQCEYSYKQKENLKRHIMRKHAG